MVKASDALVLPVDFDRRRNEVVPGKIGQWKVFGDVVGNDRVHGNLVILIVKPWDRIYELRCWQQFAEVATPLRLVEHLQYGGYLAFMSPHALIRKEEKRLIFENGTAQSATESVPLKRSNGRQEVISGVQGVIAEKLEYIAMECVGSRLNHLIDDAAGGAPIFRLVIIGEDLELPKRIRIWVNHSVVAQEIVVIGAIHEETERLGGLPAS